MDRFLVYQPNHGMAVEAHLMESAMHLADVLDRVLVLPRLPVLETTEYARSIDHYFSLPRGFRWLSTEEFFETVEPRIGILHHVIPHYAREYNSEVTRQLHPVWLDNIERPAYFERVGYHVDRVVRHEVHRPLTTGKAREYFASPARVIGLTHVNRLLAEGFAKPFGGEDHFHHHATAPTEPQDRFLRRAQQFIGDGPYTAIHWRRSRVLVEMASRVLHVDLPSLDDLYSRVPPGCRRLFLATDADESLIHPPPRALPLVRFSCPRPHEHAVMDLTLCSLAETFLGTHASTFSHLIGHLRHEHGHPPASTVLL